MNARPLTGLTCLLVLQVMGEVMSRAFDLPFPGPVTGMILLLVVLQFVFMKHQMVILEFQTTFSI